MLMDAQNRPSNNQSIAAAAGTIVSTDSIDMLSALDNPGRSGVPLRAIAVLTTTVTSGGAATVQAQLIESANSNLSSPTVLATGPQLALAAAVAGAELLDVPLPDTSARYLGFQYIIGTATTTAGAVTAGIVGGTDRPSQTIPMNTGL
jgi:hypothetical protein